MADTIEHLNTALIGRYAVERELGRGGMAAVFLARDLRHGRAVALKVLPPELMAGLGSERFLREITITASLTHPHILPLLDSGATDRLLFYVTPFAEGESLRQRIDREGQLPIDEAIVIARQVAAALSHAHSRGIIHRDIKPENILLESGEAVVADFGIARAISAAGGDRLTEPGFAIGTPAYMSPEQAGGARELDSRSDVYGLACVLYEMLAGHPPFLGANAHEVLARHTLDPVPSLRTARPTVSRALEGALDKALAKMPADRFPSAVLFAEALSAVEMTRSTPRGFARAPRRMLPYAATVLALAIGAAALFLRPMTRDASADPNAVVVLPFRVSGTDSTLRGLREGMLDLLAVKLNGEAGPRAVDARTVMSAWRRAVRSDAEDLSRAASLMLARQLGAGKLLLGTCVATPGRIEFHASLVEVGSEQEGLPVTVAGPPDSLTMLVDGLVARLLARESGAVEDRLATLATASLPALRAYLEGQAAYRRGAHGEAARHFERALDLDSTLSLAGVGLALAAVWTQDGAQLDRGRTIGWRWRARLPLRDQAFVIALAGGPRFPDPSPFPEELAAWERAIAVAPDHVDAHLRLGDVIYHWGPASGLPRHHERAFQAFTRVVQLDSGFAYPYEHLLEIASGVRDTALARRWGTRFLATADSAAVVAYVRWRMAVTLGDVAARRALRDDFERRNSSISMISILGEIQHTGDGADDLDSIAASLGRRASGADGALLTDQLRQLALNRGRPTEALRLARQWATLSPPSHAALRRQIGDALFGDGDSSAALSAVLGLSRTVGEPVRSADQRQQRRFDACILGLWHTQRGDAAAAERMTRELDGSDLAEDTAETVPRGRVCTAVLHAAIGTASSLATADRALAVADSMVKVWPRFALDPSNLVLARLWEARSDVAGALAAVRRRTRGQYCCVRYISTFLRTEGRLAALAGDTAGAIRAYEHYLALRADPEPALREDAERIRSELRLLRRRP